MFTATHSALRRLYNTIDQYDAPEVGEECFRMIAQEDDSLGLLLQKPAPNDETFDCEGRPVLAMSKALMEHLSERTLDIDESGELLLRSKSS